MIGRIFLNKNNKAFTLIELLAILVILAIIAVITVPIILNIIENSSRGAAIDSAYGYKKAINQYYANKMVLDSTFYVTDDEYEILVYKNDGLSVNGEEPSDGWVKVVKGVVTDYSLKIGGYVVNYDSSTDSIDVIKNGVVTLTPTMQAKKDAKELALSIVSGETGTTGVSDITEGWVAFINGDLKAYSVKVTVGDDSYIVTDMNVLFDGNDVTSINAVANVGTEVASKSGIEQGIVSYKVDTYVKAALAANSSLTENIVKKVSEMSGVTNNQPDSGWIQFEYKNSVLSVKDYSLTYGTLSANFSSLTDGNYVSTFGAERIVMTTGYYDEVNHIQYYTGGSGETSDNIVYFDPINGIKNCKTYNSQNSTVGYNGTGATGSQTTCLRWFIYSINDNGTSSESDDVVNMILDHNTTGSIYWTAQYTNVNGPDSNFMAQFADDTDDWISDKLLPQPTYYASWTDNYSVSQNYSIVYSTHARLIEADEVARIKGDSSWSYDSSISNVTSNNYQYLKESLSTSGSSNIGYWTSSPYSQGSDFVWSVRCDGSMYNYFPYYNTEGIRPVISVLKSNVF